MKNSRFLIGLVCLAAGSVFMGLKDVPPLIDYKTLFIGLDYLLFATAVAFLFFDDIQPSEMVKKFSITMGVLILSSVLTSLAVKYFF